MYNNMWFSSSLPADHPPMFQFRDLDDTDTHPVPPSPFPLPVASIPADAAIPVCPSDDPPIPSTPATGPSLFDAIKTSSDRLFFVSYRPAGTLRPRWCLVQIDLPQSLLASPACVGIR
jgi:hypothetical protein